LQIVGQGGSVVSVPGGKAIAMIDTGSTFSYVTPPIWNPLSAAWHAWCAVDTKTRCLGTPSSHDVRQSSFFERIFSVILYSQKLISLLL